MSVEFCIRHSLDYAEVAKGMECWIVSATQIPPAVGSGN